MKYEVKFYIDNIIISEIKDCNHYSSVINVGECNHFNDWTAYCSKLSRLDGPAEQYNNYSIKEKLDFFWINGKHYYVYVFAEKTNHLLCQSCNDFCKQECF